MELVRSNKEFISIYTSWTRLDKSHELYVDSSSVEYLFKLHELDEELTTNLNKLYDLENKKFEAQDTNSEVYYGLVSLGFSLDDLLSLSRREFYSLYYRVASIKESQHQEEMKLFNT